MKLETLEDALNVRDRVLKYLQEDLNNSDIFGILNINTSVSKNKMHYIEYLYFDMSAPGSPIRIDKFYVSDLSIWLKSIYESDKCMRFEHK